MYAAGQNKSKRIIHWWQLRSKDPDAISSYSWRSGIDYLFICKMANGFQPLSNKAEKNLDPCQQYWDGETRVWYGSKDKKQSIKKARKRKFNSTAPAGQIWQGSTSEVIN